MKEKLTLVELLFKDLLKNFRIHAKNVEKAKGAGNFFHRKLYEQESWESCLETKDYTSAAGTSESGKDVG